MQVAALLSDLKSLSACDHESAMALVSVHHQNERTTVQPVANPDLKRAKDLIELHYSVKVAYEDQGVDAELIEAREKVDSVLRELNRMR